MHNRGVTEQRLIRTVSPRTVAAGMTGISPRHRPDGVEVVSRAWQSGPLKIGVLVDLERSPTAGGHVKCWERLAKAAVDFPDALDLTVHFSGGEAGGFEVARNVHYRVHAPVFSTAALGFLSHVPAHTDLAFFHPGLARHLGNYDVIHTTDAYFAFSRTAALVSRRKGIPLVDSVHTDTPGYSRIYTARTIERILGENWASRMLLERLRIHERIERNALEQLKRHQARAAFALVSKDEDRQRALDVLPASRVGYLRRGVDRTRFCRTKRDRAWLEARFGVPQDRTLVFFAGRLSPGKNVMVLARAMRQLADAGLNVHLLCAGEGPEREAILSLLGDRTSCPGFAGPEEIGGMHASADIFALPSEAENIGQVVNEAMVSGVPVLVARQGGQSRLVHDGETGFLVSGAEPEAWARAVGTLVQDGELRAAMGRAALAVTDRELPSWRDVLIQDLLPVWRQVAIERTGRIRCSIDAS